MSSDAARYFPRVLGNNVEQDHTQVQNHPTLPVEAQRAEPIANDGSDPSNLAGEFTEISDETLMDGICAGDREALAQLFGRYARLVRTVACRILRDEAEADDLLQELFLFINRKCAIFDSSKGSARSWIVQMTYQRAIDRRRYLASRHFYTQMGIDGPAMEVSDPSADVLPYDQSMQGVLGKAGLEKMKQSLSADQWTTMQLYFFDGLTIDEIAVHLGQSAGNVRNHYYRGLEKLRKQMVAKKLQGN